MEKNIYIYIIVMAVVTYLIRVLPMILCKREIKSQYIKSFLYYVPYACLASMTFPAIVFSTSGIVSGIAGFLAATFMAYREKSLLTVAAGACVTVFFVERIVSLL